VRKGLVISSFLLLAALSFGAQGHGRGKVAVNPGTRHSNAPSGKPAASSDRDKGKNRAEDVGKGKKKGLNKHDTLLGGWQPPCNQRLANQLGVPHGVRYLCAVSLRHAGVTELPREERGSRKVALPRQGRLFPA
jgi:hypothetical protein